MSKFGGKEGGGKGSGELTEEGRRGEESELNKIGLRLKAWRGGRGEGVGGKMKRGSGFAIQYCAQASSLQPRPSLSHPCDTRICNDGAVLEEDQGMQLNRGSPCHLSIAVPSVEVVCQCAHSSLIPCRLW